MDLVIAYQGRVWLLEFKIAELGDGQRALDQIKARGDRHRYAGQLVTLIGMDFSREQRNLARLRLGAGVTGQPWHRQGQ